MKEKKKFTKSYRILQWGLFFAIIIAYIIYLLFSDQIQLTGLLTPTILTHFVLLILIMQIQTLLDMYSRLKPIADASIRIIIAIYGAYVAIYLYMAELHLAFPLILAFIALMNGAEAFKKIKKRKD